MLIKVEDLNTTLEIFKAYKIEDKFAFEVLNVMNGFVEKGMIGKTVIEETFKHFGSNKKNISKTALSFIYSAYAKDITTTLKENKERLIHDHLLKYDSLIENGLKDPRVKDPRFFHKAKIDKLMSCMDTMRQKETLLGLHRKSVRIILNNKIKQQRLQKENAISRIDMSALTIQEKIELNAMLEKARGYQVITDISTLRQEETIDIDHEDVIAEIVSPMAEIAKINSQPQTRAIKKKGINDVKKSLREKFAQISKEKMLNAGVKI